MGQHVSAFSTATRGELSRQQVVMRTVLSSRMFGLAAVKASKGHPPRLRISTFKAADVETRSKDPTHKPPSGSEAREGISFGDGHFVPLPPPTPLLSVSLLSAQGAFQQGPA